MNCERRRLPLYWFATFLLAMLMSGAPWAATDAATPEEEARPNEGKQPKRAEDADARQKFLQINYIFNRKLYAVAIPEYRQFLKDHPDFEQIAMVYYALGLCEYHVGTYGARTEEEPAKSSPGSGPQWRRLLKSSVTHMKRALRTPGFKHRAEAIRLVGQCYLELRDYARARKAFTAAMKSAESPEVSAVALLGLAETHYVKGDYSGARKLYSKFLDQRAAAPAPAQRDRATFYLAMSIYRSGDSSAKSLTAFRKITGEDGVHKHDALYMAALVLAEQGDEAGSVDLFEQLVNSGSPTYAELARFGLGSAYFKTKNYAASEKVLDQFVRDFPRSTRRDEAFYLLSQVRLQSGKKDEAAAILRQIVDSPSVGDQAGLSLARTLSENGRADEAAETVQATLKLFPDSSLRADLQLELGLTELNANRFDRAAANFSEFLASQRRDAPGVDRATYLLAYTSHRHGRHDESLEQCREFRAHHANSRFLSDVIRLEAENHFATANYPSAVEAYKSWLIQVETDESQRQTVARVHMRIAQAMYLAERYAEASEHLESNAPPRATTDPLLLSYDYYRGDCNYQLQRYLPAARRFKSYIKRVRANRNQLELQPDEREVLQSRMRDARFKLGHSLQLAGKNGAARTAYARALKADPKTPYRDQLYFELGQVAYKERKLTIAGKSFRRLLKKHPRSEFAPQARFYLGVVESESGDFNRAADHFSELVRRHPDHRLASEGEYRLAIALKSAGKLEEASEVLRQFRSKYPNDERLGLVRLEEAVAISKSGDPEKALYLLSKLRESPSAADYMARILYETAWCYRALGTPEKAVESYTEILDTPEIVATAPPATDTAESSTAVTPGFPSGTNVNQTVRIELAELEFEQKNYKTAKRLLDKLAAEPKVKDADATDSPKSRHTQGQQHQTVLYRLTWCHHMLEDSELVQTTFARFEDQFPESELYPELAYLAAKSYLRQDRITEAGKLFKRVARDYPESREAALSLVSYGECQLEDKRFDEAKKVFSGFLKRFPESDVRYRAHFGVGWSDENLGRLKHAIASYRTVTYSTASPTAARAQFQIGQCFVASEDYRKAIVEFLKVSATYAYDDWNAKALLQVAGCFETLKDRENSAKYYREVIAKYPSRDESKLARERLSKLEVRRG